MQSISVDSDEMRSLAVQLAKAKKSAWIVGAGISTAAAIPDFRSAESGLFASLKAENPELKINSGKELFHTNLFQRPDTTRAFYMMCAQLKQLADAAEPTEVHKLMHEQRKAGKLFRVYTQNIDALEAKAGLSYGLGEWKTQQQQQQASTSTLSPKKNKKQTGKAATAKSPCKLAKGKGREIPVDDPEPATLANERSNEQGLLKQSGEANTSTSKTASAFLAGEGSSSSLASMETTVLPDSQEEASAASKSDLPSLKALQLAENGLPALQPAPSNNNSLAAPSSSIIVPETPELAQEAFASTNSASQRQDNAEVVVEACRQQQEEGENSLAAELSRATSSDFDLEALIQPSAAQDSSQMDSESVASSQPSWDLSQSSSLGDFPLDSAILHPSASQGSSQMESELPTSSQHNLNPSPSSSTGHFPLDTPSSSQVSLPDPSPSQASTSAIETSSNTAISGKAKTIGKRALTIPDVIPLHGTLDELHCPKCGHVEPTSSHLHILASGHSLHCPSCLSLNASRAATGDRARGVGVMKISVVLYGEEHTSAARVGEITSRDLIKSARPDYLIVAGTTLKIPGVKKLVRELSRLVKQLNQYETQAMDAEGNVIEGKWVTQTNWKPRVLFVNRDPPQPEKTWSGIFDYHIGGDVQDFARAVRSAMAIKNGGTSLPPMQKSILPMQQATLNKYYKQAGKKGTGSSALKTAVSGQIAAGHNGIKVVGRFGSANQLPTSTQIMQEVTEKAEKVKSRPCWKGYALVPEAAIQAKHKDYWCEKLPEGSKRRRSTLAPSPPTPIVRRAPPSPKKQVRKSSVPASDPYPSRAEIEAARDQIHHSLSRHLEFAFSRSSLSGYGTPQLSGASTPPSLASDVSTASDDLEDAASTKDEEVTRAVTISSSSSQEYPSTDIVPDSLPFPEDDTKMLVNFSSSNGTIVISDSQASQETVPIVISDRRAAFSSGIVDTPNRKRHYVDPDETESELSDVEEEEEQEEVRPVSAQKRQRVSDAFQIVKVAAESRSARGSKRARR